MTCGWEDESQKAECHVCHQEIPKSRTHYGGVTCYSCRAFFRRNTQREKLPECKNDRKCRITYLDRKQCSACRYEKCCRVGMQPELVLNEDDKQKRFRKLLSKKQEEMQTTQNEFEKGEDLLSLSNSNTVTNNNFKGCITDVNHKLTFIPKSSEECKVPFYSDSCIAFPNRTSDEYEYPYHPNSYITFQNRTTDEYIYPYKPNSYITFPKQQQPTENNMYSYQSKSKMSNFSVPQFHPYKRYYTEFSSQYNNQNQIYNNSNKSRPMYRNQYKIPRLLPILPTPISTYETPRIIEQELIHRQSKLLELNAIHLNNKFEKYLKDEFENNKVPSSSKMNNSFFIDNDTIKIKVEKGESNFDSDAFIVERNLDKVQNTHSNDITSSSHISHLQEQSSIKHNEEMLLDQYVHKKFSKCKSKESSVGVIDDKTCNESRFRESVIVHGSSVRKQ